MIRALADNRASDSLAQRFRRQRFALFASLIDRLPRPVRILDVGGTLRFWKSMGLTAPDQVELTILNLKALRINRSNVTSLAGDARNLQFPDKSFDVVFSNSVIEHVGFSTDQRRMADEVRRVGQRYFVQTPNRYFPMEPHFLVPGFQFLPVPARIWLVQHFRMGWYRRCQSQAEAREIVNGVQLLSRAEVMALFPDGTLYREKVLGLTKSFVIYGGDW